MARPVAVGRAASVRVPATSANLGPGFDCLGMALGWYDELSVEVVDGGHRFELSGEGADEVPRDESHLVLATIAHGLADLGHELPPVVLRAHATIPHGRGLGSSAAAIVAGLALAWGIARPDEELDRAWACRLGDAIEGHPDNVAPAVLGGVVLAWTDVELRLVELPAAPGLAARVWVPGFAVPTAAAREVLPSQVPFADAVVQAGRAAALVYALTADPSHLLAATADRLHQPYRAPLMAPSAALVASLRDRGVPAVVSGAGPTVLALGTPAQLAAADRLAHDGFVEHHLALGEGVRLRVG